VDRLNQNQGAESTLSFLLSLAEMKLAQIAVTTPSQPEVSLAGILPRTKRSIFRLTKAKRQKLQVT
jgi:hypothetical protein